MNLQLIKQYGEHYPGGLRKLAVDAGMSEGNLHRCIRNNKIQANDLEAISRLLNVEVKIFFTDAAKAKETEENVLFGDVLWMQEKITLLEQSLRDKDELISVLKQIIGTDRIV
ncbi:hypothetical protein [Bacteroides acidifaciens]|uniref:hypothetical protein n=1 Tax=Bacteroides acidifaciens TaxID=85831 RepID=UPI002586122F|nr:hypothetical protein [Bacteroides acidifaciens]